MTSKTPNNYHHRTEYRTVPNKSTKIADARANIDTGYYDRPTVIAQAVEAVRADLLNKHDGAVRRVIDDCIREQDPERWDGMA